MRPQIGVYHPRASGGSGLKTVLGSGRRRSNGRSDHGRGHQNLRRRRHRSGQDEPGHTRRGVRGVRRALGVRQVHSPAHDRGPRGHKRGQGLYRGPGGERPAAPRARYRYGLPELRALPAHERAGEHGLRAQAPQDGQVSNRQPRPGSRPRPLHRAPPWTGSRRRSPAASVSGSPWAGLSSASPRPSSWTSPSPTSTPSSGCR